MVINMFVFRIKRNDDDIFEFSLSKPCAACCNTLKARVRLKQAIGRNGKHIRIKWSTGNINMMSTSYINIKELIGSEPSSGTRRKYNRRKQQIAINNP